MECDEFPGQGLYPKGLDIPDLIVTGASMWESIEKEAIIYAHAQGIKSMTIVDRGSNFWGRFSSTGEPDRSVLPDLILAPDEESRDNMAKDYFPPKRIIVTGNPYFDTFRPDSQGSDDSNMCVILCVMQPEFIGGQYRSDASWFHVIKGLAEELGSRATLIVRPHPKENPEVYQQLEQMGIDVDEQSDITDLIIKSDIVIGKNSTALIEAVFRGKVVISLDCGNRKFERLPTENMGLSAFAFSENELREIIQKSFLHAHSFQKLKQIRYYNDGRNTERAGACVLRMLNRAMPKDNEAPLPRRMTNG
jgi:UDP-N-acetylglucosamine 2-epimerase